MDDPSKWKRYARAWMTRKTNISKENKMSLVDFPESHFMLFVRTLMVWLLRGKSARLKGEALQEAMVEWEEWVEWIAWTWIEWALDQMAPWSTSLLAWWTTLTSPMRSSMVSRLAGLAALSLWQMWGFQSFPIVVVCLTIKRKTKCMEFEWYERREGS